MDMDTLDEAIRDAVEKNPPPPDAAMEELLGKTEETPQPKKEEIKKEEPKAEEETENVDADIDEVKKALVFYRALSDPKQSKDLAEAIAKNAGYDLTKTQEVKQLNKDIKSILREKLGDNYDVLSGDKLSEAFEEALSLKVNDIVTEKTKPVLDRMSNAEKVENDRKAATAMDDFFKRNDIPEANREAVAGKMMGKMRVMPATAETPIDSYLDDLYLITHREATATKTVKNTVKKINENAKERNSSGEGTGNEDRIKRGSAMPSLDESVRAAFKGVRLDD